MAGHAEVLGNVSVGRTDDVAVAGLSHADLQANQGEAVISESWGDDPKSDPANGPDPGDAEYPDLRGYLWSQLVNRLQAGDPQAMEELYSMFSHGMRYYLARQLEPDEIEDRLHDAFLIVVDAIRAGELRDSRRLMGFIRTVVRRIVAASIDKHVMERRGRLDDDRSINMLDRGLSPEGALLFQQQAGIVREVLAELSDRDRQILTRFYVDEQPALQICEEMGLTMTQFRLLKSRAKNRFGELGKKKVKKSGLSQFLLRVSRG